MEALAVVIGQRQVYLGRDVVLHEGGEEVVVTQLEHHFEPLDSHIHAGGEAIHRLGILSSEEFGHVGSPTLFLIELEHWVGVVVKHVGANGIIAYLQIQVFGLQHHQWIGFLIPTEFTL